jgi:glucose-6-phosphate isomerase
MSWLNFTASCFHDPELGFWLDYSRLPLTPAYLAKLKPAFDKAFAEMEALEKGAIANPDEGRMVGHYWLRSPERAPSAELTSEIRSTLEAIHAFCDRVHSGELKGASGRFENVLVIGIGGSALGPQFVAHALGMPGMDKMTPWFLDNTDPDGMDYVFGQLKGQLGRTLALVISKSGGTVETRNGMLEAARAWKAAGLDFAKHAVAITGPGSKLDKVAVAEGWLARFPMWDWVGGRTSELGPVGLVPAALQGIDIDAMLAGAAAMDRLTRRADVAANPAALMAATWFKASDGRGAKDLVVLPYKDRLLLFSRYLQQLIMESLGKELDLDGKVVNQGLACYGNKGSTDQHAYVQQLREGVHNFFVTFIEVLRDRAGDSMEVEPGLTSGDYLQGFLLGTRDALSEKGRESVTITVTDVSARTIGMLIALYERTVGLYAQLIHINAYHQPGVEAGKKAAGGVVELKRKLAAAIAAGGAPRTAPELAAAAGSPDSAELAYKILERLAANNGTGVVRHPAAHWPETRFGKA